MGTRKRAGRGHSLHISSLRQESRRGGALCRCGSALDLTRHDYLICSASSAAQNFLLLLQTDEILTVIIIINVCVCVCRRACVHVALHESLVSYVPGRVPLHMMIPYAFKVHSYMQGLSIKHQH